MLRNRNDAVVGFTPTEVGRRAFPTTSAGKGKNDGDGQNPATGNSEGFYACAQCGFWCLDNQVGSPGGTDEGAGGITVSSSDPSVASGYCPFCGSANSRGGNNG